MMPMAHLRFCVGFISFLCLLSACHSIRVSTIQQGDQAADAAEADSDAGPLIPAGLHKNPHKTHVMWCGFGNNKTMDIIRKHKVPNS